MAEFQPSKLAMRVRFPSPALLVTSRLQSIARTRVQTVVMGLMPEPDQPIDVRSPLVISVDRGRWVEVLLAAIITAVGIGGFFAMVSWCPPAGRGCRAGGFLGIGIVSVCLLVWLIAHPRALHHNLRLDAEGVTLDGGLIPWDAIVRVHLELRRHAPLLELFVTDVPGYRAPRRRKVLVPARDLGWSPVDLGSAIAGWPVRIGLRRDPITIK